MSSMDFSTNSPTDNTHTFASFASCMVHEVSRSAHLYTDLWYVLCHNPSASNSALPLVALRPPGEGLKSIIFLLFSFLMMTSRVRLHLKSHTAIVEPLRRKFNANESLCHPKAYVSGEKNDSLLLYKLIQHCLLKRDLRSRS